MQTEITCVRVLSVLKSLPSCLYFEKGRFVDLPLEIDQIDGDLDVFLSEGCIDLFIYTIYENIVGLELLKLSQSQCIIRLKTDLGVLKVHVHCGVSFYNGVGLTDVEFRLLLRNDPGRAVSLVIFLYYIYRKKPYLSQLLSQSVLDDLVCFEHEDFGIPRFFARFWGMITRTYRFGFFRLVFRLLVAKDKRKLLPARIFSKSGYITSVCGPDGSGKSSICENLSMRDCDSEVIYFGIRSSLVAASVSLIKMGFLTTSSHSPNLLHFQKPANRNGLVTLALLCEYFVRLCILRAKSFLFAKNYILDRGPVELITFNSNTILAAVAKWMSITFLDHIVFLDADANTLSIRSGEYSVDISNLIRSEWNNAILLIGNDNALSLDVSTASFARIFSGVITYQIKN